MTLDDLNPYGLELFESDYANRPGRESDGKKHQDRESVAYGWMALAVRYKLRSLFVPEAMVRLFPLADEVEQQPQRLVAREAMA